MKKSLFIGALLCASVALFAQKELVDFSQIELASWGGSGNPEVSMSVEDQTITVTIIGTPGWQWGNQVKITLTNVAAAGLDPEKEYKLSFTATASTDDCSGVSLKFFDNNELFYTDKNYLSFNTIPFDFASEWVKLKDENPTATNGTIVFDFGWDPAQTITISKLSFLERSEQTAVETVRTATKTQKVVIDGQVYIIRDDVRYNALGAQVQ